MHMNYYHKFNKTFIKLFGGKTNQISRINSKIWNFRECPESWKGALLVMFYSYMPEKNTIFGRKSTFFSNITRGQRPTTRRCFLLFFLLFPYKVKPRIFTSPVLLSVNVRLMEILKSTITKKVILCFDNLGEENF